MKFTEGGFRDWAYQTAKEFFGAVEIDGGPWCKIPEGKPARASSSRTVSRTSAVATGATRPTGFRLIATLNFERRLFERRARRAGRRHRHRACATSITSPATPSLKPRTARPKYANKDVVNPGSVC